MTERRREQFGDLVVARLGLLLFLLGCHAPCPQIEFLACFEQQTKRQAMFQNPMNNGNLSPITTARELTPFD
jgi:hypothetical protein